MKIKTITCHDVYNVGASLQAFALATYLKKIGHEVEIIDYKPEYLNRHYSLTCVNNPTYNKPILREAYLLAKLPERIRAKKSKRKAEFDYFKKKYLPITSLTYKSNEELKQNPPDADVYFTGSDQIWNAFFQNGRDPAFYLDFAPQYSIRASYAASFASECIPKEWEPLISGWISHLDYISVRESTGLDILKYIGICRGVKVLDPVFLLDAPTWEKIEKCMNILESYLILYDFDSSSVIEEYTKRIAKKYKLKIYSILPCDYCDMCFEQEGPQAFIYLIHHAQFVISNSFHATAFSILFKRNFTVFDRKEKINSRMHDLISYLGLKKENFYIDYIKVQEILNTEIVNSKKYINTVLLEVEKKNETNCISYCSSV